MLPTELIVKLDTSDIVHIIKAELAKIDSTILEYMYIPVLLKAIEEHMPEPHRTEVLNTWKELRGTNE